ncbi:hypothetical protein FDA94_08265 [Herbidospora galbida]|uniref:Uncharacterized protein n=1 Tax=Herbidospora galbida TaxID=2575442 RepID=A0A4U3MMK1_9ACTN|nr:hypothetical protein [Herbidospora galbida]TKK89864.1 hypothetical protein FDA94_08265 [Herbidospora galbida]
MHTLLGALVLTAGLVAVPTAAPTAAHADPVATGPCWAGSWTVTKATAKVVGKRHRYFVEGGAGIEATFTRDGKYVVARYDFRESAPLTGGATLAMDGVETFTYTFGGHGKHTHGKVVLKPRTGDFGATLERSGGGKGFSGLLREAVAHNEDLGAIPRKGTYTCVPDKSLRIFTHGKSGRTVITIRWELTRS